MWKKNLAVITLVFIILGLFLYMHERSHQEIAQHYGCVDIRWKFLDFENDALVSMWCERYNPNVNREGEAFLQSLNDVVGYHLLPILFVLLMLWVGTEINRT